MSGACVSVLLHGAATGLKPHLRWETGAKRDARISRRMGWKLIWLQANRFRPTPTSVIRARGQRPPRANFFARCTQVADKKQ